jgi:hypothetical protein
MGAETFRQIGRGATHRAAFQAARDQALYDYGHRGYTGSLAEKQDYVLIEVPATFVHDPEVKGWAGPVSREAQYAEKLIDNDDPRISSKWGPAGCIQIALGEWLFFGWASS